MTASKGAGFEPISGIAPVKPAAGSLLNVARTLQGTWRSGVSWRRGVNCGVDGDGPGFRREFCGSTDLEDPLDLTIPEVFPYEIYVPYQCDWVPLGSEQPYIDDAKASLDAVTDWHVSRELWTGATEAENDSLQSVATDESATDPVHPVTAVGTLLEAWSDCTQQSGDGKRGPIVHVPAAFLTSLIANHVINQQGDVYYGPMGSLVSGGPGYPTGTSARPTGVDAGEEDGWIYISGPVEYAVDVITVAPDREAAHHDSRTNAYRFWAQRWAISRFDPCCVFAVKVYQPSPTDSGGV